MGLVASWLDACSKHFLYAYLLVGVHVGEAAAVAGLAALGGDFADFVLRAGGSGVSIVGVEGVGFGGGYRLAKLPGLVFWVPDMVIVGFG
jgi:hypothetical protein